MRSFLVTLALILLDASLAGAAPRILVDDFEDVSRWSANPAAGVELRIASDEGVHGKSMRLDFEFLRGGGYAVARRAVNLTLPANYRFHFAVRGVTSPQDLEFKLIDSTGANVWWMNRRNYTFPVGWDSLTTKKRQIEFAWGPIGGGDIRHVAAIEIAITAGSGGRGAVWLDDFTLEELPAPGGPLPKPTATASSSQPGSEPWKALDAESKTAWRSARGDATPALTVDLGVVREFSAVLLDWVPGATPEAYVLESSEDGTRWSRLHEVIGGRNGRNWIHTPESEGRYLRVRVSRVGKGVALAGLHLETPDWAKNENEFFHHIANNAPRGQYPRGMLGEQPYWTIAGADRDPREVLVDEDGRIEPWKGGPSFEPFLVLPKGLVTWNDVGREETLIDADLPIPRVTWRRPELSLSITANVDPRSNLYADYCVRNVGRGRLRGAFVLTLRPFQVNPPSQFLNTVGGMATLRKVEVRTADLRDTVFVDDHAGFHTSPRPEQVGVATFDEGDLVADFLAIGRFPKAKAAHDPTGHASVASRFSFDIAPGDSFTVGLFAPLRDARERERIASRASQSPVVLEVPASGQDALLTLREQLKYALVTRDSVALMPGARSYERSWIRDGALSANAFLRMGQPDVAKDFAEWFALFVPEDGAVPCCVDRRGADPTPEHDSHGEFVYLVAEVLRYTGDLAFAERLWPAARRAATHINALRAQRRTAEWRTPANAPYFGLLPPSISHEGYSAKPMHSYWDDFFALRGLTDAAYLAQRLGHEDDAKHFAVSRDTFAADLSASIRAAQKAHKVDYVPGCADLGDFDATSTTIALDPVDAEDVAGEKALKNTFDVYWANFKQRRDGPQTWDAYTPYEVRTIGAMARLGDRDRATQALTYFLNDRRPKGFMQWAEVVGREYRKPRFIGDMPHTWVGTDYVRSVIDLFAYTRGADSALVIGSGLPRAWVADAPGVRVAKLPTPFGPLAYRMRVESGRTVCDLETGMRLPSGGIVVAPPPASGLRWCKVTVNGNGATLDDDGRVTVRELPATVVFETGRGR